MSVLPAVVTHNWTLKLASLGLALFLWAVVRAEPPDRELLTEVPVLVQIGDLDWREAQPPEPATVQVRFAGPARQIVGLNRQSVALRIPIDAVHSPDTTVQLRRDWVVVEGGTGLVVEDVLPATVDVHLERTSVEVRPIRLVLSGRLPEGKALAGPVAISPQLTRLRGSASRLSTIDSVSTMPLELSGMDQPGRMMLRLDTTGVGDLAPTPSEVEAVVRVENALDRVLPPVDVEAEGPGAAGLEIDPPALAVAVRGAEGRVSAADLSGLRLVVAEEDLLDLAPGESRRVAVRVLGVDDPFLAVRVEPDSVTVRRPEPDESVGGGR